jgi:hypothetical protein
MDIKALNKLESAWIKLEWREWLINRKYTDIEIMSVVDTIDIFKSNRQAKEIVIAKLKSIPAYVTILKTDYVEFLDWVMGECIERELYESCHKITKIKNKLCSLNLKKS